MTGLARLDGYGKRVLVVEEHAPVRDLLIMALMRNGYNAYEATDRFEALATMGRRRYDAVLADCCLSQPGEILFLRICRQQWPDMPIIVLSSDSRTPADSISDTYACLSKPFDLCDLLRVVRQATSGKPVPASDMDVELTGIS